MPLPKPKENEKEQEFISRFMADPAMNSEYPDQSQRSAIAYQTWKETHKQDSSQVSRVVTFRLDEFKADKAALTPEGYLVCKARPTRTGIFDYRDNGKLVREYRPPEEVFAQSSLDSLKLQPVTYYHPDEMVTAENIKAHQVGVTGQDVTRDGDFVACTVKVTDKNTIQTIFDWRKAGRQIELSCGYNAEVEPIQGEHPTEGRYDCVQTNIRYNHVSIVDQARAGHGARLILDKKDQNGGTPKMAKFKKKEIKTDSFQMDEVNVEVSDEAIPTLERLSNKLDQAVEVIQDSDAKIRESQKKLDEAKAETQTKIDELKAAQKKADETQAKLDQAADDLKKAKEDVAELSNMDSPRVQGMLQAKTTLETTADKLKVDRKDKAPQEIKIGIIKAVSPEFKEDGKSAEYINARYDAVIEMLKDAEANTNNSALGTFIKDAHDAKATKDPRAEFIAKSQELGRK